MVGQPDHCILPGADTNTRPSMIVQLLADQFRQTIIVFNDQDRVFRWAAIVLRHRCYPFH